MDPFFMRFPGNVRNELYTILRCLSKPITFGKRLLFDVISISLPWKGNGMLCATSIGAHFLENR